MFLKIVFEFENTNNQNDVLSEFTLYSLNLVFYVFFLFFETKEKEPDMFSLFFKQKIVL